MDAVCDHSLFWKMHVQMGASPGTLRIDFIELMELPAIIVAEIGPTGDIPSGLVQLQLH
jgi:hypothetical protein